MAIWRWMTLKLDLETIKITSVGVTIDYIDIRKIAKTVKKLCKMLHSFRQDILRPVLNMGRHVSFETENRKKSLETTRCRGKQILGGAKGFCPNLLKLTRKICVSKMITTFFEVTQKKVFIFMCSDAFRQSVSFITQWEQRCRIICASMLRDLFPYFQRFCLDIWRIKTFRCSLAPPPHTPLSKLTSRSSVETPSLLFMVLNTGTQQTLSKLACSILVKKSQNCQITLTLQTPYTCHYLQIFHAH